jgi:hypothetical protein
MNIVRRLVRRLLWLLVAAAPLGAQATTPVLRDPMLPEALRHTKPAEATRGAALQAQVEAKLRARFMAADHQRTGHLSRAQAETAGLGYVVRDFDQIDRAGHGSVSWAQVRDHLSHLAARAAAR